MIKKTVNWGVVELFIALLVCDTAAQLFFKKSVLTLGEFPTDHWSSMLSYLQHVIVSPMTLMGILMILCAFLLWLAIISLVDLSKAHPITCLVFGTVALSASWIFHEPFTVKQAIGVILIVIGSYITSEHG